MITNHRIPHLLVLAEQSPGFTKTLEMRGVTWTLCKHSSVAEACLERRLRAKPFTGLIVHSPLSEQELQALREQTVLKRTPILVFKEQSWCLYSPDQSDKSSVSLLVEVAQERYSKAEKAQKQVLVVDDVSVNRKLLGGYLKQLGHESLFASNGLEALSLLETITPDLILMDVEMPEKDGLETTYELRGSALGARDCPVLAVTGHSGPGERERCLSAGMNDVLVKPLTREALKSAIGIWASRKINHAPPSLPNPLNTQPPVSLDQLQSDVGSDPDLMASVVTSFLEEVEQGFPEIEQAILEKDFATIRTWAYSVEGASSYFGAKRLERLAQSLELLGEESQGTLLRSLFDSFLKEWKQVKSFLEESLISSGAVEVEIRAPLSLEPEQLNLIDLHSFLNVLNVVAAELQNLTEAVVVGSDIEGCLELVDEFSHQLRQPEQVESTLTSFAEIRENFWSRFGQLTPKDNSQDQAIIESSRENLRSIFAVIERRCSELLDRLHHPHRWDQHSIEGLLNNTRQMLAAVEKNAKGRYHIVYNIAAQEAGDYLVHLDIKSVDGELIVMPAVFVDVLRDLIANARKYTDAGGTIQAGLVDDGKFLRLAVEDNGRGIPRHEISKVVGFGYRAGNVADKPTMGAGFGLTKAFWATKQFDGRMWIRSENGHGTRVTIQLPSHGQQDRATVDRSEN